MANGDDFDVSPIVPKDVTTPDIDPSRAQTPPSSQVPADNTDEAKALQQSISSNQELLRQQQEAHAKTMKEFETNQQMIEEARQRYEESLKMPVDGNPVPPIDNPTRQQVQAGIQTNTTWPGIIGGLAMVLAGALGGKGHHASITGMMFMGGMMQAYSKGQQEAVKANREEYWRQMEYNHQVIQDRLANYRAALQDRRLNSQQALELFKTYATAYGDIKYQAAAERGDLNTINRQLEQDRLALARLRKETTAAAKAADTLMGNSGRTAEWERDAFANWSDEHLGRMPVTQQEQDEARRELPYAKWSKDNPQTIWQKDPETGEMKPVLKHPEIGREREGHLFNLPPRPGIDPDQRSQGDTYGKSLAPDKFDDYFGGGP